MSKCDPRAAEWAKTEVAKRFLVKNGVYGEVAKHVCELTTLTVTCRLHHLSPTSPNMESGRLTHQTAPKPNFASEIVW